MLHMSHITYIHIHITYVYILVCLHVCVFFLLISGRLSWVKIHGTIYKPGCIVVSGYTDDSPEFSEVIEVIIDEDGVLYFVLQKLLPPEYYSHISHLM